RWLGDAVVAGRDGAARPQWGCEKGARRRYHERVQVDEDGAVVRWAFEDGLLVRKRRLARAVVEREAWHLVPEERLLHGRGILEGDVAVRPDREDRVLRIGLRFVRLREDMTVRGDVVRGDHQKAGSSAG